MRALKNFFKGFVILLALLVVFLYVFDYDYMLKAVRTIYLQGHTTAFLKDYEEFDNNIIEKGAPQPWPMHLDFNKVSATENLQKWNDTLGTIAFMIIKNDSIWFENYYDNYTENSKSNSFSMAKSMISAMLGKAITEGKIESLDQPVGDFFPEFNNDMSSKMTVGDLSSMSSGLNWDEDYYSPFSITTRAYFYDDLEKMMLNLKVVEEPGQSFKYLSGNTQLLGMVIEKATGQSLSKYLSDQFWKPMGAENEAFWQIDSEEGNLEKAYCCIASNARDFARFGKLYKNHGRWNNQQLLDSTFIAKSVRPRFSESPQYGYGWWLHEQDGHDFFMMRGHLGQYVIVEPNDNVIIVRLGHQKTPDAGIGIITRDIKMYIEEAYNMLNQ
ncbi:MAG: beta-lactamase family protein [Bacteroidia bacterium]|nr:beta-lactamase family protein [Bacteroidia bacterium]NND25656.1 serine hydrolase [Flavobacteriaceae bacterium]NNK59814.1 serine hydrolase [Flavobacteriaceae bacterium]NNL32078.1 serine hydrolase [Flavobacteriaceae bacterium]RZW56672.1 MAG: class C beta-lactamase-related serine hydrolase [Flavobacteriaceae bacterium]